MTAPALALRAVASAAAKPRRIEVPAQSALDGVPVEFREMVEEAERRCWAAGTPVLRFETKRTLERCQFLYGKGRAVALCRAAGVPEPYAWPECPDGIVTNATSNVQTWHGAFLAVDWIHPKLRWDAPPSYWTSVAAIIKPVGFVWGGDWEHFPDRPHYQHAALPVGPRLADKADIRAGTREAICARYGIRFA